MLFPFPSPTVFMQEQFQHNSKPMRTIQIWFDGGAAPNPGKAYGSYEIQGIGLTHKSLRQQFGEPLTSNQAEYLSLIAALKWLSHHATPATDRLEIWTDSQLVCHQVRGLWKVRVPHVRELWFETLGLLCPYEWVIYWHGRQANVERFGH